MTAEKIDGHHHIHNEDGYVERLLAHYDTLGIRRVVLAEGPPSIATLAGHDVFVEAVRRWPDRVVGFAWLDLDNVRPDDIRRLKDEGFLGLKCICPQRQYNDPLYDLLYETAEKEGMPMLFHLGIVARFATRMRVDNNLMRAVYLDTIARMFPDLTIIGAHLGNPWYEEAAMACRWNPNLYFDITGSTLKAKSPEFIGRLLWWGNAQKYYASGASPWSKIIFGTDVHFKDAADVMNDYENLLTTLGVADELRAQVWGGTLARLIDGD